jgi:hypothetical protein
LPNWTQGTSVTDIHVAITQNGNGVTATVTDAIPAGVLRAAFGNGADTYTGTIDGNQLTLVSRGDKSFTSGSCAFTIVATLDATVSGDVIQGTIHYTPDTNGSPDCAAVNACSTTQSLNGTRPPTG